MEFKTVLFYVFSVILVIAAVRVITARNPVHAALFLVLSFFSAAGIWMLLKAEFLAIVLVLVYVGAVMVLFLFVVMMLDINLDKMREGFWGYFPLAATIGVIIVLEMAAVLLRSFWTSDSQVPAVSDTIGQTKPLGMLIYTEYVYAFEIAAVILLVAIVAAVALTLRKRKDTKYFDPAKAVKVKASDRVRLVSMKAESTRNNGAQDGAGDGTPASGQQS
ncbi:MULTISPECIES: NADH-quinone oxidoreductase subunit J [unclassified Herbaspirillum]|uniref:NADH-quinone oxidoreductase subunit J n=1 Tax=unclassified Herbaspirillum TaxID=2624150 RepID=UPI0011531926|nr:MULTISPECIES: NADH-quinone oxidoreductase subunit J [unclassified Herbaspirillum]MBB5392213.1 NADH-quinone oxidoreductase subunit J [Herbaspirillum sp. SJZ102]TQK13670.1 NADH dehydrogenase subunit J [Herbaspirillum sp. SJZ130]TQK15673.1 NADH dehydrogenase subunit J [Herbaspirillum sp. SJZ106]TWC71572.1 NADH dehydrogenase subunit J [Herbaspirillum sp. SJZ099]